MQHTIWTVLKTGGEYTVAHVAELRQQLAIVAPNVTLNCLSDVATSAKTFPLMEDYPGWWAKLNLCHPQYQQQGSMFYCDLDTVFVGPLGDILNQTGDIVLRDFYRGGAGMGSGFMRLSMPIRAILWEAWKGAGPVTWMNRMSTRGDQGFMEEILKDDPLVARWQDRCPNQIVSWKVDVRDRGKGRVPKGARVIAFHGHPRPFEISYDHAEWIADAAL